MAGNEKSLGERVRILGNRAKHTWETQVRLLSLFSAGFRLALPRRLPSVSGRAFMKI
jgi:hypothetical protein